jgi:hypothetical protein
VHRFLEIPFGEKGKPVYRLLIGLVIDPVSTARFPTFYPETTEIAIPVKKHDGTGRKIM